MNQLEEQEEQAVFQEATRQGAQLTSSGAQDTFELVSESCRPQLVRGKTARITTYSQARANQESADRLQASIELIPPPRLGTMHSGLSGVALDLMRFHPQ